MTKTLIVKNKKEKTHPNPLQQTFNRLRKKIDSLEKECQECTKTLDRHLEFHGKVLLPKIQQSGLLFREEIKLFYPFFKNKKTLKKQERSILKQIIANLFEKIAQIEGPDLVIEDDLSEIFKETVGFSYQDQQLEDFEAMKKSMEAQFSEKGINLDLSDVEMEGSKEEIMEKIFESMSEQGAFFEKEDFDTSHAKNKKQKSLEIGDLQKKEIGMVYKQLAKIFHPDLETDPTLKLEKEGMMKKITSAYEARDLHTLLSLELETLTLEDDKKKVRTEDQLKVYNQLLQTQVNVLQEKLRMIPFNHKYEILQSYLSYKWKKGDFALNQIQKELDEQLRHHQQMLSHCEKGNALKAVRELIKTYKVLFSEEEELDLFMDLFDDL